MIMSEEGCFHIHLLPGIKLTAVIFRRTRPFSHMSCPDIFIIQHIPFTEIRSIACDCSGSSERNFLNHVIDLRNRNMLEHIRYRSTILPTQFLISRKHPFILLLCHISVCPFSFFSVASAVHKPQHYRTLRLNRILYHNIVVPASRQIFSIHSQASGIRLVYLQLFFLADPALFIMVPKHQRKRDTPFNHRRYHRINCLPNPVFTPQIPAMDHIPQEHNQIRLGSIQGSVHQGQHSGLRGVNVLGIGNNKNL